MAMDRINWTGPISRGAASETRQQSWDRRRKLAAELRIEADKQDESARREEFEHTHHDEIERQLDAEYGQKARR